jgi:hypothetical protein
MIIAQDTNSNLKLVGGKAAGCTLISKGNVGAVLNTQNYEFLDSAIISESPLESESITEVKLYRCLTNLSDVEGGNYFYGSDSITKKDHPYDHENQYNWLAPEFHRLPYIGNTPTTHDVPTLMTESVLITPQNISNSVPNYTTDAIEVELSLGVHTDYDQGLHGETRLSDTGNASNRRYASSGVGAWWFSQEDVYIKDTRSEAEGGIFTSTGGGSFFTKQSDQNSGYIRSGSFYRETATFPDINSYITTSGGVSYFNSFNFAVWVRNADTDVSLWELTNNSGDFAHSKIEITGINQITITESNAVSIPHNLNDSSWHLILVTVDQRNSYKARIYIDRSEVIVPNFKVGVSSVGSNYKIYTPKIDLSDKTVEVCKPRFSVTQGTLTYEVVKSIYDQEVGELPE